MEGAFARARFSKGIFAGQVWRVPDHLLTFADYDRSRRTLHTSRPVIVVQGDDHGQNQNCPTVLVMLLSSDTSNKRSWEDEISGSETPLEEPSIVKVHLIQPIPRQTLIDDGVYVGEIEEVALRRIMAHLLRNLGLVS